MTSVKMLEYGRQFICTKCKFPVVVKAEFEMKNAITKPSQCENPDCKGKTITSLSELNPEFCKDYQEIKMQETVNKLDVGSMPTSMWVTLEDDLVDSCKPGDNITVCGIIKRRQNQFIPGKKIEVDLVIKANHVFVNNNVSSILSVTPELKTMFDNFWQVYSDTPLAARDIILKSICPQLFGLGLVKLALAVVLAGGSNIHNNNNTGVKIRAEPHLLLVGDPGTAKSQLLNFASKIIPRSVLTTGVGSTAAGLTVAAVKENGEWQLEAGALVMADGGICCIDEFNTIKPHDRTSIHEAMEQQKISVAKASIVCELSTRCSILAATNPKGSIDTSLPLSMNVALASPLLSRFDLILLLKDKIENEWDSQLVDNNFTLIEHNISKLSDNVNWNIETLQAYFAVIKKNHPLLTQDSNKVLSCYYQAQRRKSFRNKSRTTVRLLDSLVRLSQGHARLMFHTEVEIMDAVMAVALIEAGIEADSSVCYLKCNLRSDFPLNPTNNYTELLEVVLKKLELNDLLEKELQKINRKKGDNPGPHEKKTTVIGNTASIFFQENVQTETKTDNVKTNKMNSNSETEIKEEQTTEKNNEHKHRKIETKRKSLHLDTEIFSGNTSTEQENKDPNKAKTERNYKKQKKDDILNDLTALNCIPSVNDNLQVCDEIPVELNLEPIEDIKETLDAQKDTNILNTEVLSQKTRTKNFFKKFRYVPKPDEPSTSKENFLEDNSISSNISFVNAYTSTQISINDTNKNTKPQSIFENEEVNDFDI